MKAIIITGTSRGLGKGFFDALHDKKYRLVCIARTFLHYQKELAEPEKIELIKFDLDNIHNITDILNKSTILNMRDNKEILFINNAGVVSPIGKVGKFDSDDIVESINVNFISPVLITNFLCQLCDRNKMKLSILNITTGAADRPIAGWSIYCSTKSATKMFFNAMVEEREIYLNNIDPGVMDTPMQQEIRSVDNSDFPLVEIFKLFETNNELKNPHQVALNILSLCELI